MFSGRLPSAVFSSALVLGLLCSQSLAQSPPASPPPAPAVAPAPVLAPDSLEAALQSALAASTLPPKPYANEADDLAALKAFYIGRNHAPVWVTKAGVNDQGRRLAAELQHADDWGLKVADFSATAAYASGAAVQPAEAEVALARAALKYARFARGGRIADPANELSQFLDRKPQTIAPEAVLARLAGTEPADAVLRGFNPQHPQFERLRQAYLAALADEGQVANTLIPPGPMLHQGMTHPNVAILRRRLKAPAAAPTATDAAPENTYDESLAAAVKAFQTSAGLRADGFVGERTRGVLNGDRGTSRAATLLANMEMWRWMPEQLGTNFVQVNIPEYQVRVVENDRVVHSERVVTGKMEAATPVFSADMKTIVFQPKWGVPESIKINEMLPRLQDGRGLRSGFRMTRNGREVDPWNIDWSRADIRNYDIHQPSGDDNALGVVKFLFPNHHAVYLHDTPSKRLFNASMRSFSHGCVRVRNPVKLAEVILAADKNWSGQKVRNLVDSGPADNPVKLDTTLPVHITYFTATVDENGAVAYHPDVYGHEKRITLALQGRPDLIVRLDPAPVGQPRAVAEAPVRRKARPVRTAVAEEAVEAPAPKAVRRTRSETPGDWIQRALGGSF